MQEEYEEEMERVVRLPSILTIYFIPLCCFGQGGNFLDADDTLLIFSLGSSLPRSVLGVCKVYLTGKGASTKGAMRAGEKVVLVHIINISRGKIGTGRPIHQTEIGVTSGKLLNLRAVLMHYLITTPSWALTGNGH